MRYHAKMTTIKNYKPLRNGQTYGNVKVIFYIVWSSFLHPLSFFSNFLSKLKYLGYAHQYLDESEPDLFRFQLRTFHSVCMTLRSLKILLVVYYVFGR